MERLNSEQSPAAPGLGCDSVYENNNMAMAAFHANDPTEFPTKFPTKFPTIFFWCPDEMSDEMSNDFFLLARRNVRRIFFSVPTKFKNEILIALKSQQKHYVCDTF